ncbi:hypothetical protein P7K49_033029 [Saguinus oedipus]|uniref:Uncharacterized protein n=1 Tax=Saguinus oedipus TaxID=9490 RepID=A0ABQ9TQQ9_SAGOE|nr:hypothetical protein P7K49_033029 [Saguinus oedipus]
MEARDVLNTFHPVWTSPIYTALKSPARQESRLLQLLCELRNSRGSNRFCGKLSMKVPEETYLGGEKICDDISTGRGKKKERCNHSGTADPVSSAVLATDSWPHPVTASWPETTGVFLSPAPPSCLSVRDVSDDAAATDETHLLLGKARHRCPQNRTSGPHVAGSCLPGLSPGHAVLCS